MSYALVSDIPASWDRYVVVARTLEQVPAGLIVHIAGPTDEGFRIVEVWANEFVGRRRRLDLEAVLASVDPEVRLQVTVRDLQGAHLVLGAAVRQAGEDDWSRVETGELDQSAAPR
jgi:hypothetical protein